MKAFLFVRLLFVFFLFSIRSIHTESRLELPDGIVIIVEQPEFEFQAIMLPNEQAILPVNAFSIEYNNNNPMIVSRSGRRTSFNPNQAPISYERFRERWMNDAGETQLRMRVDPIFREHIAQHLNDSFSHMFRTNSEHIYDRILARLSIAQIIMNEEPYHTNLAIAVQQLNKKFFDSKGALRTIDQESGIVGIINQCASFCGIQKQFSCSEPKSSLTQKAKALFGGCSDVTRIALNATNKAIINCLQACKQFNFTRAHQIARNSNDPLLLQRIIEQYKQEVEAALYDADGIYRYAHDDPIFKQLTPAARKHLKNNSAQRAQFNMHVRARAAMKNNLMERWHIDQSAPPSVHCALYELIDDKYTKDTPYAITKIATVANSPEIINAFYLPNGVLKGFENYSGTKLIPASTHLLKPEAAPLRILLNQAVYENHEQQTALANAMLKTMTQLINDMNAYGPLFGIQWPPLPEEPLLDDVETLYDCIDNIRRLGYPHLAHTLNTVLEYSEGFKDGTQEHTRDVGNYLYDHPAKSAALAGSAAVCCYAFSAFPLAVGSLKLIGAGQSLAELTKPSAAKNPYERGKEHAQYALDMVSQYVVGKAGGKVLKKFGACYRHSHELASRLFDKLEKALTNLEPIDVTYQPIIAEVSELSNSTALIPEPISELPSMPEVITPVESLPQTVPSVAQNILPDSACLLEAILPNKLMLQNDNHIKIVFACGLNKMPLYGQVLGADISKNEMLSLLDQSEDLKLLDQIVNNLKQSISSEKPGEADKRITSPTLYLKEIAKAQTLYESIRNSNTDIQKISQNTTIPLELVEAIKKHVFFEDHILRNGIIKKFDTDIDIADAWERLLNGNFTQSDLLFLQHEFAESLIMQGKIINYDIAHQFVDIRYNWRNCL